MPVKLVVQRRITFSADDKSVRCIVDYLHPDDVDDAVSSSQLPQPERLGRIALPSSRHRPPSNAIQPVAELRELRATLPGSEDGGNVGKRGEGSDGNTEGGKTKVPDDEDKTTGYSSGPDDDDDYGDDN